MTLYLVPPSSVTLPALRRLSLPTHARKRFKAPNSPVRCLFFCSSSDALAVSVASKLAAFITWILD